MKILYPEIKIQAPKIKIESANAQMIRDAAKLGYINQLISTIKALIFIMINIKPIIIVMILNASQLSFFGFGCIHKRDSVCLVLVTDCYCALRSVKPTWKSQRRSEKHLFV